MLSLPLNLQSQRVRLVFAMLLLLLSGILVLAHFRRAPAEAAALAQSPQAPVQAELITIPEPQVTYLYLPTNNWVDSMSMQ